MVHHNARAPVIAVDAKERDLSRSIGDRRPSVICFRAGPTSPRSGVIASILHKVKLPAARIHLGHVCSGTLPGSGTL